MTSEIYCSTIIPTVGRPTLTRTVMSVLDQQVSSDSFEVIVVNDSGKPLPPADWMSSKYVRVIETNRWNRSVARNAGAAIARGRFLHFLDDDDWLLPGAFESLWSLAKNSEAAWIFGGYQLVDREDEPLELCLPDEQGNCAIRLAIGEWIPLQVSLIRSDSFFAVGGFASLESLLGGDEDVDLSRQISLNFEIAGVQNPVAVIRFGHEQTTTNYKQLRQQSRISREKMLNSPGAAKRLQSSAQERAVFVDYWHGRLLWCYLASVYWNLNHRRPFTAFSRLITSVSIFGISWKYLFSRRFWLGTAGRQLIRGWLFTGK